MKRKKILALGLAAVTALSSLALTGCGGGASSDTSFTMWIYQGADAQYYTDYAENPVNQYLTSQTWGEEDKKVSIEYWVPPAGTAADGYSTMMGSGDYPDILDCSIADSPAIMYKEGIILDLTEYVEEYMPNYVKYIEEHPSLKDTVMSTVDGEEKYLGIMAFNEDYPYTYSGYCYRRDWIVKYGADPSTGAAFTGGYTDESDPDSWQDNVKFPSWYDEEKRAKYQALVPEWDGSDPAYISDWEWMFDIFEKAYADLGINDTYCISLYYPGVEWVGGLCSSFGGGNFYFYENKEGTVEYGPVTSHAKAYLQCMNNWYEKGWLDQDFNERTSDMFYSIDNTTVRQGKIGMWCGMQSELGGRLDMGDEYTDGMYVAGCALPINDVYGTDADKYVEPDCLAQSTGLTGVRYALTTAAEDKDIPTLLTMIDYLYTDEGARMASVGLSPEEIEELGTSFYADNGCEDGFYAEGEDGRYAIVDTVVQDSGGLRVAGTFQKFPHLQLVTSINEGYADTYEHYMDLWIQWEASGQLQGTAVTTNMTEEDDDTLMDLMTKCNDYVTINTVDFVKGTKDIDSDKDWGDWCKMIQKYNYQKGIDLLQPYADQYEIPTRDAQ